MQSLGPGVTFLFRVAKEAMLLGDTAIESGAVVFISTHSVNRDPAVFADPDHLQLTRNPNPHMAYGFGNHYCLGAPLARMQMNCLFATLLGRFAELEIARGATERDHYSLAFSGFRRLCVKIKQNSYATLPQSRTLRREISSL